MQCIILTFGLVIGLGPFKYDLRRCEYYYEPYTYEYPLEYSQAELDRADEAITEALEDMLQEE